MIYLCASGGCKLVKIMVDQLVSLEIMELNVEMSSMNIAGEPSGLVNHHPFAESVSDNKRTVFDSTVLTNGIQPISPDEGVANAIEQNTENPEANDHESKNRPRRSLRKRIRPADSKLDVLRNSIKVQKMDNDVSDIEKYYLSKKVKRLPSTLETIFEEPKGLNDKQQFVSTRKFKRTLNFDEDLAGATRLKLRKRQLKAKKLPSSKSFLNRKKISMDTLLNKLSSIESDKE